MNFGDFQTIFKFRMIDLHTHSTASDGTLRPAELIRAAVDLRLEAVALTDHDTVAGIPEFLAAGGASPVQAVPGVELSCSWYGGTMHILGLFIDHEAPGLLRLLEKVQVTRRERNRIILEKLREANIPITLEQLEAQAGSDNIGRPHIGVFLIRQGICANLQDAFTRFLGRNQLAYVRRFLPLPDEVITAIHQAGGIAVWAHPLNKLRHSTAKLRQVARFLQEKGLDGMEVLYSDFTEAETQTAHKVAHELNLLFCGGTDYHGTNSPGVALAVGRGRLQVPASLLSALMFRAREWAEKRADPEPDQV